MTKISLPLDKTTPQEYNNKAKEKQDAAEETMKTRCKLCFKEIAPQRRCGGHGGGGGGSSSSGDEASNDDSLKADDSKLLSSSPNFKTDELIYGPVDLDSLELQPDDLIFDEQLISELIADGLLLINNDADKGILTFELRCSPNVLSQEQRDELKKFFNAIQKELEQFKEEKGIADECKTIKTDASGNILSLRISLPTPALYDAFIQRLASQHLIPVQNVAQENNERVVYPKGNLFNPNPLNNTSTKASPDETNKSAAIDAMEEEGFQKDPFNPSPFSTVLKSIPGQS